MANWLKRDPSRTSILRRQFMADMKRRFKAVSKEIVKFIVEEDAFGLIPSKPFTLNVEKQAYRFLTNSDKVKTYRKWLKQQVDAKILSPISPMNNKPWTSVYVTSAYKKGMFRAYTQVHAEALAVTPNFYKGSYTQFLRDSFNQPELLSKVELLSTRAFNEMQGITDTMSQQMSRILADGLAHGTGVGSIAKELTDTVGNISRKRAMVIARTEIINAHAEGQLDAFEMLGIDEVGAEVEWSTAGDDSVCEQCDELSGQVYLIDDARGMIPQHPNCRCAWLPVVK